MELRSLKNIADSLAWAATHYPNQIAVAEPKSNRQSSHLSYRTITFQELQQRSLQIAAGVRQSGVVPGDKISLMVPPGIDFVSWVFGLFKAEATVILIDPGMGKKNMARCLAEANPDGLAGIALAQAIRWAMRRKLPNCKKNFTVGKRWVPLGQATQNYFKSQLNGIPSFAATLKAAATFSAESPAAIIFTTGSTGPPKGVLYRHRHFIEQTAQIRDYFAIEPGGADVSGFPLFALFNTGMATSTIFPRMDATRPAQIVPEDFLDAVRQFSANQSFGSPALWNTVARYCEQKGIRMPGLRRVLTAGAPVPEHVLKRVRNCIAEDGEVHTPYGATESLPVACTESRQVIDGTWNETKLGRGICVGKRWPQMNWKVIEISDTPLNEMDQVKILKSGQVGELIVFGPVVTDCYVTRTDANALHKIQEGNGFWHRMGDVGYLDADDRFWFCGRKGHRVVTATQTLFTIPCEALFNCHPDIYRCALVGTGPLGNQVPAIIAEPWPEKWNAKKSAQKKLGVELNRLAESNPLTASIKRFYIMKSLPVDIRHNAKIFREQLSNWVEKQNPQ